MLRAGHVQQQLQVALSRHHVVIDDQRVACRSRDGELESAVVLEVVLGAHEREARVVVTEHHLLRLLRQRRAEGTHPDAGNGHTLREERLNLAAERAPSPEVEHDGDGRWPSEAVLLRREARARAEQLAERRCIILRHALVEGASPRLSAAGCHSLLLGRALRRHAELRLPRFRWSRVSRAGPKQECQKYPHAHATERRDHVGAGFAR